MSARVEAAAEAIYDADYGYRLNMTESEGMASYALAAADAVMFSDEAVERAAKESWNAIIDGAAPWDELDEFTKDLHTQTTRAVIAALKGDQS